MHENGELHKNSNKILLRKWQTGNSTFGKKSVKKIGSEEST